jgi:hypothetical protein
VLFVFVSFSWFFSVLLAKFSAIQILFIICNYPMASAYSISTSHIFKNICSVIQKGISDALHGRYQKQHKAAREEDEDEDEAGQSPHDSSKLASVVLLSLLRDCPTYLPLYSKRLSF